MLNGWRFSILFMSERRPWNMRSPDFRWINWDMPLVEGGTSASNNFLGHAQHNAYHAGQIVLIKKLLQTDR